jgi:hypothetical protein
MSDLIRRLRDEKFDGNLPAWEEGHWSGIPVKIAEDADNFYYRQGKQVFVQRKEGKNSEMAPYCFGCGSEAQVLRSHVPQVSGIHPGEMLSEGGTRYSFYCVKCEGEVKPSPMAELMSIEL